MIERRIVIKYTRLGKGANYLGCTSFKEGVRFIASTFLMCRELYDFLSLDLFSTDGSLDSVSVEKYPQGYFFCWAPSESNPLATFPEDGMWAFFGGGSERLVELRHDQGAVPEGCFVTAEALLPVMQGIYDWSHDHPGGQLPAYKKGQWYEWSYELGFCLKAE